MRFFDSHAHYWDTRFAENEESVDELIAALFADSVSGIINVGTSFATSRAALDMAKRHPGMYAAAGIHPSDTRFLDRGPESELADIESLFRCSDMRPVALGEIGLDYHYPDTDRERQARYFELQLSLAESLDMPVIIHDREAHGDVFDAVRRHPRAHGVIHSYSGSPELALAFVRLGWYISFSGTVSFRNAARVTEAARVVPEEYLLLETDAPYLTPHPYRGRRNDSGYLVYTADALAHARGCSLGEIAAMTEQNARRLFRIKGE